MSSSVSRIGFLCGASLLFAMVIASAQDRKQGEPAERDRVDVFISVEGRTVVLTSVPEGSPVEKGDVICELDPSDIKDRLANQEIIVRGAEADVHATRIARVAAVMAVNEYQEGTFRQELAATEGEIKLAESKLASAEGHLAWCRRMFNMGYCSMAEKTADELALKQARIGRSVTSWPFACGTRPSSVCSLPPRRSRRRDPVSSLPYLSKSPRSARPRTV